MTGPPHRQAFGHLLVNTFIANLTTSFLWFALTFWIYLETRSVLATSLLGGSYMLLLAVMGVPFGGLVDRWRKKSVMVAAQVVTAAAFALGLAAFLLLPRVDVLTLVGIVLWMALMPVAEAAEQTVLQRVVPYEKQGRVFGLAQAVEVAASPISAFLVGPLAHFVIVPWMASPEGRNRLGWLLGDGVARGLALVFVLVSVVGLAVTLAAMASRPYRTLSASYASAAASDARDTQPGTSP